METQIPPEAINICQPQPTECQTNSIPTIVHLKRNHSNISTTRGVNTENLVDIERVSLNKSANNTQTALKFCTLNTRSVKNKSLAINDYVLSNSIDILGITETWLGTDIDNGVIAELVPEGYQFVHIPRSEGRRGGGVGVMYKNGLNIRVTRSTDIIKYSTFEFIACNIKFKAINMKLIVVYRPPPSNKNHLRTNTFMAEWSQFLIEEVTQSKDILITGDLNFHLDDTANKDANEFKNTLQALGLTQHVTEATHVCGHTLDVIITSEKYSAVSDITVTDPGLTDHNGRITRDHFAISFSIRQLPKPPPTRKSVTYRELKAINTDDFKHDIRSCSELEPADDQESLDDLIARYNNGLTTLIDKHAPTKTRNITLRPNTPYYTDEIREAKHLRRKLERKWKKSQLSIDHQCYRKQCANVNKMLNSAKRTYYHTKIIECGKDQRKLFAITNNLLGKTCKSKMPSNIEPTLIPNAFSLYFTEKIDKIQNGFLNATQGPDISTKEHDSELSYFTSVTSVMRIGPNSYMVAQRMCH